MMNEGLAKSLGRPPVGLAIGDEWTEGRGGERIVRTPIDGSELARFRGADAGQVDAAVHAAAAAFLEWRAVPAPVRGQLVRRIGERLRERQRELADLVTLETGKITAESLGEVQEMIDICDFAVGLSRQLYGLTIVSERAGHRLMEQWYPLGPIGVISAFNFPVAVWAWNAMIALVCGDPVVWKPSEKTPLAALACHAIATSALEGFAHAPPGLLSVIVGDGPEVGQALAAHRGLPLISATGSTAMGKSVAQTVAARLGRALLELGGNNAAIVSATADLELATRAIVFAAAGTCGQRCTSLRRLIVHRSIVGRVVERVKSALAQLPIGDPRDAATLVGPLIDRAAADRMQAALAEARAQGGVIHGGELVREGVPAGGAYVRPALVEIASDAPVVQRETFAPILYVCAYDQIDEAIAIQNAVAHGLASAIFTSSVREAELFCSPVGSDCGIANVNIGTSGAEIGGAFGGEKETGGGRESGSDAWKAYMRRATNTINYSSELPLAQGIRFELG